MLTFHLNTCTSCDNLRKLLCELDKKLSKLSTSLYDNATYLANNTIDYRIFKLLTYYREILIKLTYNPNYYGPCFTAKTIASRIKTLL